MTDRERMIIVGLALQVWRNEIMPWHAAHRFEHEFVRDAAGVDLFFNHLIALGCAWVNPVRRRQRQIRDSNQKRRGVPQGNSNLL
jgi:hypothetical protein